MVIRDAMILAYVGLDDFCGLTADSGGYTYSEGTVSEGMDMLKFIKRK